MTTPHQPLLDRSKTSYTRILLLIFTLVAIICSAALVSVRLVRFSSSGTALPYRFCERAVDQKSCSVLLSEMASNTTLKMKDAGDLLQAFLEQSKVRMQNAMNVANKFKYRINNPGEQAALADCMELMESSMDRTMDSMVAVEKQDATSYSNAHAWLSSVLTNHVTCLDGLEGSARTLMEPGLNDLISRARTSLAIFISFSPRKTKLIDPLIDGFPSWVSSKDRKLLQSLPNEIKANVVVAKDGSGKYKTLGEAVAAAPDKSKTRYIIYVKKGTYKENVEIGKNKKNLMIVGDGMKSTIITGSLNVIDGSTTFRSATVAAVGDGFMAQDIWFQNTAGPQKHQAVALRVGADQSVINRCQIDGYQDTLYTHSNRQFYRDSEITGTVDFIFGDAAVVFQNCKLVVRKPMDKQSNMVTAQGRIDPNQNTGTSIQSCNIIASSDLEPVKGSFKSYLGRPWKEYSTTVVMQSHIGDHIDPSGWSVWNGDFALKTLYYGEYMNKGPGAGTSKRVKWPGYHVITSAEEAKKFTVAGLILKNLILSWRSKRSTFLQVFSSLFFIFLIYCIEKATNAQNSNSTAYKVIRDPKPLVAPVIPSCEDKFFIKLPCYDFVWSGNESQTVDRIVRAIRENNPGRPIPESKVKSFRTTVEVDDWLFNNRMHVPGALHFQQVNASVISYGLQTNSTPVARRGQYEDPTLKFQIPLQVAAEREIARSLIGDPSFRWTVEFKEFAHPAMERLETIAMVGPTFFLAIAMFSFVFQIGSLVSEKELKLRQAMTMMGLLDSAYWLSWLTWEGLMTLISSLFIILFGMMFQFDFFLNNSFAVLLFIFFLFQLNMVGFAFMLSAFMSKSSSATTVGFSIFIIGFFTQIVTTVGFPYSDSYSQTLQSIWSLFPPNLLAQALRLLSDATASSTDIGISWSRRTECAPNDDECVITINDIYIWLLATFIVWVVLAIYFDNIIPNASGVRKPILYFLRPGYWTGKGGKEKEGGVCSCIGKAPPLEHNSPDDEDVLEEENLVRTQTREGTVDPNVAVQIRGLAKTFPGTRTCGFCCKCKKTAPYHAVKGLWVNLAKDQLFCLLGPNGAGKTTAINCLTGITPVTSGDALIYGNSVQSSVGMSNIRRIIGVCPQFDILWNALSGKEHLELFASVKGLLPSTINSVVQKSLEEVRLTEAAKVRAGSYSGGMKRRLSVAVALLGDPKLVILDEPTTGMDPITRRHVWDIIESAKRGRAIVLTTHSMEEADVLSDRIGIMVKGRLSCLGTSIRLKSRFGTGFIANVSFTGNNNGLSPPNGDAADTTHQQESVKHFFKKHLDVEPKEETQKFLTFVIPHDREKLLTGFFKELEERAGEFGIADIQLGLATLEEVFLNIARQAELESAAAEGRLVTLTITSGASVQIPIGARFVGIPGTESAENPRGIMVEVYWQQDDTGTLCISGHSAEIPLPQNFQPMASVPSHTRNLFGRRGPVQGVVINPDESFRPTS